MKKLIKNNIGFILFVIAFFTFIVLWSNYVEANNDRMNAVKLQERS